MCIGLKATPCATVKDWNIVRRGVVSCRGMPAVARVAGFSLLDQQQADERSVSALQQRPDSHTGPLIIEIYPCPDRKFIADRAASWLTTFSGRCGAAAVPRFSAKLERRVYCSARRSPSCGAAAFRLSIAVAAAGATTWADVQWTKGKWRGGRPIQAASAATRTAATTGLRTSCRHAARARLSLCACGLCSREWLPPGRARDGVRLPVRWCVLARLVCCGTVSALISKTHDGRCSRFECILGQVNCAGACEHEGHQQDLGHTLGVLPVGAWVRIRCTPVALLFLPPLRCQLHCDRGARHVMARERAA